MDVEATQKMNVMIKELTQKGIVTNFDDAVDLAGSMYSEGRPPSESQVDALPAGATRKSELYDMIERKVSSSVHTCTQQLEKELSLIREELNSLKQATSSVGAIAAEPNQAQPVQETLVREVQEQEPRKAEPSPPKPTQKTEANPRQGGYSSDDVSIENFFYCGER